MAKEKKTQRVNYLHRTSYTAQERLVGLFVLLTVGILILLALTSEPIRELFQDRMVIYGRLPTANGVGPDTLVRVSGIKVGKVSAVDISKDNDILVTMHIAERFRHRLHRDASAELSGLAMFGKTYIDILPGSPLAPPLREGAELQVAVPPSLDEIVARVTPVLNAMEKTILDVSGIIADVDPAKIQATVDDVQVVSANLRQITEGIKNGQGTLGAVLTDSGMREEVKQGITALNDTLGGAQAALAEIKPILANAGAITNSTREVTTQLPDLVTNLELAVSQANLTLSTLNTELQQFPDLVIRMKLLLDETNRTLEGMQRIWPLSSAIGHRPDAPIIEAQPLND